MLIFDDGLRIIFDDDLEGRKSGIIKCQLAPVKENSCYLVNAYKCGKLSDGNYMVLEKQIRQVFIKDIDGFGVWVRLDDLYMVFPNGTIIKPDTIYKYDVYGRNSGRYPWGEYARRYIVNDEKAVKAAINSVWGYRTDTNPKKVIFNGPATIVIWQDGTKTIVKRREGEEDDREKAIMYAILKKLCGNKAGMDRYLKQFKVNYYDLKEVESNEEKEN